MVLLLSEPSTAPYVLNEQFAAAGLDRGENVYYYSLERTKEEVTRNIKSYLTKDSLAKLQLFDAYAGKLKDLPAAASKKLGFTNHAVNVVTDLIARIVQNEKNGNFRIVIESLTEAILSYGLDPVLSLVRQLSGVIQKLGGTACVLLIKGIHDHVIETKIRHIADGVLEFGVDRQGFGLYAYISISKMRGVTDATRLLLYKETDKGLWLESTRRVF